MAKSRPEGPSWELDPSHLHLGREFQPEMEWIPPERITPGVKREGFMRGTNLGGRLEDAFAEDRSWIMAGADAPDAFALGRMPQPALAPAPAGGGVDAADHRVLESAIGEHPPWTPVADAADLPFRCICHLEILYESGAPSHGTGWLAAPDLVVTAAHNLHHPLHGRATSVNVRAGLNTGRSGLRRGAKAAAVGTHPGWGREGNHQAVHDVGWVRLPDSRVGSFTGWFGVWALTDDEIRYGALTIHCAGYPDVSGNRRVRRHGEMWKDATRLRSAHGAFLTYRLDTTFGCSGAPVFAQDAQSGERYVVATHTHASGDGLSNTGRRVDAEILDLLDAWTA